jgi:hypothetical protein
MCIALALGSMMKKKKDEPNSQEPKTRVVSAQRPDSPSSRVPPQLAPTLSQGGYDGGQNGNLKGNQS